MRNGRISRLRAFAARVSSDRENTTTISTKKFRRICKCSRIVLWRRECRSRTLPLRRDVSSDPGPDETAQNVAIVSEPVASPMQLAQTASMHAGAATRHAKSLEDIPGVQPSILQAAHAAASALESAIQS
jgi:hypothetical protein